MSTANWGLGFEELKDPGDTTAEGQPIAAESPFTLQYNTTTGLLRKVIYADEEARSNGQPFSYWSETVIRDPLTNKVVGIKTITPAGSTVIEHFVFGMDPALPTYNKLIGSTLERL